MQIGTTYARHHIMELGLSPDKAFTELLEWNFDLVRIGTYWSHIQPTPRAFDLCALRQMLDQCQQGNQGVVLTIGMKAPRWPEYYIPNWLNTRNMDSITPWVLTYIERVITELATYSCIKYWQVENEPLDPVWPHFTAISRSLLEKEMALIRSLDQRPIHLNMFALGLAFRQAWPQAQKLGNTVGLDVYYKAPPPILSQGYLPLKDPDVWLRHRISQSRVPVWITELQAEAWERGPVNPHIHPPSMNPELFHHNLARARLLQPEAIFLWGYEYWLWQRAHNQTQLYDTVKETVQKIR
jgi:hypothetical protein